MGKIDVKYDLDGIKDLCLITPTTYGDSRGYFMETYNQRDMEAAGFHYIFVQHNQSSSAKGTLRGLHYQINHPQAKLVRVIKGEVFDVAVDLRTNSKTYGKWHGELLSEDNKKQFLIPRGFAHGFLALSEKAEFCYLVDAFYHPNDEGGVAWNDPEIGITWPNLVGIYNGSASANGYSVDGVPLIMSEKDQKWLGMKDSFKQTFPNNPF